MGKFMVFFTIFETAKALNGRLTCVRLCIEKYCIICSLNKSDNVGHLIWWRSRGILMIKTRYIWPLFWWTYDSSRSSWELNKNRDVNFMKFFWIFFENFFLSGSVTLTNMATKTHVRYVNFSRILILLLVGLWSGFGPVRSVIYRVV